MDIQFNEAYTVPRVNNIVFYVNTPPPRRIALWDGKIVNCTDSKFIKGMQNGERSRAMGLAKKRYLQDSGVLTEPQDQVLRTNQVKNRIDNINVSPSPVSVVRRKGGNHLLTTKCKKQVQKEQKIKMEISRDRAKQLSGNFIRSSKVTNT